MDSIRRSREIIFIEPHPDPDQAGSAALMLADCEGVERAVPLSPLALLVEYDLRHITLQDIEQRLQAAGFHLDNSLLTKLKRALAHYTEDTLRANLQCEKCTKATREVFVRQYQRRPHGCRDPRPDHWRGYL